MRICLSILVLVLLPALAHAQPGPTVVTTLKATATAVDTVCVGCPLTTQVPAANSGMKIATITFQQFASPSVTTDKLYNIAGSLYFNGNPLATGSSIAGTANTIGMFTGAATIGNSLLTQASTTVTMAGTLAATTFSGSGASITGLPTTGITGNFVATVASGTGITSSVTTGNAAATTITLNNTAVTPAAYGSSTSIPSFTVDQQGRLTAAAGNVVIAPAGTLTGATLAAGVTASSLTSVGTITSGTWNAGAVTSTGVVTSTNNNMLVQPTTATNPAYYKGSNTGGNAFIGLDNSTGSNFAAGNYALAVYSDTATGLGLLAANGAGTIRGYTGGTTQRFQYDANGNYILGTANITDAVATPTISSGFGTSPSIVGKDYAFIVTVGTGGVDTNGVVAFNATFANAPACSAITNNTSQFLGVISTTTQVTIGASSALGAGGKIHVLCRGF